MSKVATSEFSPNPKHIVPFGPYGAGQITAHPIGLVIVVGLLAMGLVATEELRWLILASAGAGVVFGLLLYLKHR